MTISRGSWTGLAFATFAAAQQPMAKVMPAAAARPAGPHSARIAQAQGSATSEPHVPGMTGNKPVPNQVANKTAGCQYGSPIRLRWVMPLRPAWDHHLRECG